MVESKEAAFEFLIPHEQLAKAIEPAMRDFDNPPFGPFLRMLPFLFGFLPASFDVRNVAVCFNESKRWRAGIAAICAQMFVASFGRIGTIDHDTAQNRCQLADIMSIGAGHDDR